ncbi:unnamed protein product [Miscanthus lutarioriparius]|uniref:RING-type E3 ubiquitin transferase n=1 Tax=Miscanthus lutarioriparius TaxID=422564 RepID=A0A811SJ70_9POAL|nr:unnamed protein product [Miscanthus lutarioriparius]
MSALPENVVAGGSGPPVAWWSAASPVSGDVVLSGVVLLFVALAFAFVLYHYFTVTVVSRRRGGTRDGAAVGAPSSSQQRGTLGGGVATGGFEPSVLRALLVTVYKAKDRAGGEALECAVCLAELTDGEAARFLPRCQHGFHAECIDLWLRGHSTCPLCRVNVDLLLPAPSSSALPPALPEPANYPTNLPTNVLFWGSQDPVTVARTSGTRSAAPGGASPPLVIIHVREAAPAVAPPPTPLREGDAAKAQGLARLSSLRRLWNRGRHDAAAIGYTTLPWQQTA